MNWAERSFPAANNAIAKITPGEQARLNRLRAQTYGNVLRALNAFLSRTQSDETLRRVIDLLESSNLEGVMRLIDQHVAVLANELPNRFRQIAQSETDELIDRINAQFPDTMSVGVGFDPTHESAAQLMASNRLDFISEFGRKQRDVTREALVDALRSGAGPRTAARAFRDTMGLTTRMHRTVNSYRQLLESLSSEALMRDIRDRRFDPTVRNAISNNQPLSADQVDRMTDRYRQRMKIWRSEMIARTETTKTLGQARHEAQLQTHAQAGIPDSWVRRKWVTSMDGRERHTHHEMNGQEVEGMNSYFQSPSGSRLQYPGDPTAPPEELINCRCFYYLTYVPPTRETKPTPVPVASVDAFPASQMSWGIADGWVLSGHENEILSMFRAFAKMPGAKISVAPAYTGKRDVRVSMTAPGILIQRYFREGENGLNAHHDFMELPFDMQNKGIAKQFMRDSMDVYKQLGVNAVDLEANINVGGYAWAKYGFTPTSRVAWDNVTDFAEEQMRGLANRGIPVSDITRRRVVQLISSDEPRSIWDLADLTEQVGGDRGDPIGKRLLLGSSWKGQLYLDDAEAMQRFENYVN